MITAVSSAWVGAMSTEGPGASSSAKSRVPAGRSPAPVETTYTVGPPSDPPAWAAPRPARSSVTSMPSSRVNWRAEPTSSSRFSMRPCDSMLFSACSSAR